MWFNGDRRLTEQNTKYKICPSCEEEEIDKDETICGYCFDAQLQMEEPLLFKKLDM